MSAQKFVHVVNFWLKPTLTEREKILFEQALQSLSGIESVIYFNVGKPAPTRRPVIDSSYDYCLLTVFENEQGHDLYQSHRLHLQFLENCRGMWDKVLIFDSVTV